MLGTLSCHLILRRRRRQRRWNGRVEALFLSSVSCPGLASIQQGGENARLIDEDLGSLAQQAVVPHSLVELGHDSGSFGDPRTDLSV